MYIKILGDMTSYLLVNSYWH